MSDTLTPERNIGPAIRIDPRLEEEAIFVDRPRIEANLSTDFPELKQTDWDKVLVYYTEGGDDANIRGGCTVNMLLTRNSRSARLLGKLTGKMAGAVTGRSYSAPSYPVLEELSEGRDVLVVINTDVNFDNLENPFEQELDASTVTAHELKHAASQLLLNQAIGADLGALRKFYRSTLAHASSIGAGLVSAAAGGFGMLVSTSKPEGGLEFPYYNHELFMGGTYSLLGGVALTALPIYLAKRHKTASLKSFGINVPHPPYSHTEECVHAYTLATRDRWEGVVTNVSS